MTKVAIYALLLCMLSMWLWNVRYDHVANAVMAFSQRHKD